jgi:hypothetical protein
MSGIKVTIDEKLDVTINTAEGRLVVKDIEDRIEAFYNGKVTKHVIWDFSGVELKLSSMDVKRIAIKTSSYGRLRAGGFNALVVKKELEAGLTRMYAMYSELEKTKQKNMVFHCYEDALQWIISGDKTPAGADSVHNHNAGSAV